MCQAWEWLLLLLAVLLLPATASARWEEPKEVKAGDTFFNPGALLGVAWRPSGIMPVVGAEVSLHHFIQEKDLLGVGAFGQWEWVAFGHHRFRAGVQGTLYHLGLELGVARETGTDENAATTSLHLAPFVSSGTVALGVRVGIPISRESAERPHHGIDVGLTLALKVPMKL